METLSGFFQTTCTIEALSYTTGDYNTQVETWSTEHSDIPCIIGANTEEESHKEEMTLRGTTKKVILNDVYVVNNTMRIKIGAQYYQILQVQKGVMEVKTVLIVKDYEI